MSNFKLLIIDDNETNIYSLQMVIEDTFEVDIYQALSAKEAFELLEIQEINLILCDIQMPKMDGFEFATRLYKNKEYEDIPLIFITGIYNDDKYKIEGLKIGAIDYITKPIDSELLTLKLKSYMGLFQKNLNCTINRDTNETTKLFEDTFEEDKNDEILDDIYNFSKKE